MRLFLLLFLQILTCLRVDAEVSSETLNYEKQDDNAPGFFKENYILLEVAKNSPIGESQRQFSPGQNSVFAGYRHFLRDRWLMGVNFGFKKFVSKDDLESFSVWTFAQESQMIFRINHPLYASMGTKLMYLLPTEGNRLPPVRNHDFNSEIGIGITGSLIYAPRPEYFICLRVDRWRGVKREKLLGTESALGLAVVLP